MTLRSLAATAACVCALVLAQFSPSLADGMPDDEDENFNPVPSVPAVPAPGMTKPAPVRANPKPPATPVSPAAPIAPVVQPQNPVPPAPAAAPEPAPVVAPAPAPVITPSPVTVQPAPITTPAPSVSSGSYVANESGVIVARLGSGATSTAGGIRFAARKTPTPKSARSTTERRQRRAARTEKRVKIL